jgi:hypothetical protein
MSALICMINGGGFLDYDYLFSLASVEADDSRLNLLGDPNHAHHWGQHFGILLIETRRAADRVGAPWSPCSTALPGGR